MFMTKTSDRKSVAVVTDYLYLSCCLICGKRAPELHLCLLGIRQYFCHVILSVVTDVTV